MLIFYCHCIFGDKIAKRTYCSILFRRKRFCAVVFLIVLAKSSRENIEGSFMTSCQIVDNMYAGHIIESKGFYFGESNCQKKKNTFSLGPPAEKP